MTTTSSRKRSRSEEPLPNHRPPTTLEIAGFPEGLSIDDAQRILRVCGLRHSYNMLFVPRKGDNLVSADVLIVNVIEPKFAGVYFDIFGALPSLTIRFFPIQGLLDNANSYSRHVTQLLQPDQWMRFYLPNRAVWPFRPRQPVGLVFQLPYDP